MGINRRQVMISLTAAAMSGGARCAAAGIGRAQPLPASGQLRLPSGHRLGYCCLGPPHGTPVLYFHGTPSSRLEAEMLADACNQTGVFLLAVDRPGMGLSSYQASHTVANWAHDVDELLALFRNHVSPRRWGLLAFSGGTPFGLSCAQQLPQSISCLAILSPRAPGAPGVPRGIADQGVYMVRRRPRLATVALNAKFRQLRRRPQHTRFRQLDRFADVDRAFVDRHADWFRRTGLEAVRCGSAGIVQDISLLPWPWNVPLRNVGVPVSIWQGTQDYSAPIATSQFLASQIPRCETYLLQNQGHFTMLETASCDVLRWLGDNVY